MGSALHVFLPLGSVDLSGEDGGYSHMSRSCHLGFVRLDQKCNIDRWRCELRQRGDSWAAEISL